MAKWIAPFPSDPHYGAETEENLVKSL